MDEEQQQIISTFNNVENYQEVIDIIDKILHHGKLRRRYSQIFYERYVAKVHVVANQYGVTLHIENYLNDLGFKKDIKVLFADRLSKDPSKSDYGEGIISDYDLFFTKKVSSYFTNRNIEVLLVQLEKLEKRKIAQNAWLNRLIREVIEDFPLERLEPRQTSNPLSPDEIIEQGHKRRLIEQETKIQEIINANAIDHVVC